MPCLPRSSWIAKSETPFKKRERPLPRMPRGARETGGEGTRRTYERERVSLLPHAPCGEEQRASRGQGLGPVLHLPREGQGELESENAACTVHQGRVLRLPQPPRVRSPVDIEEPGRQGLLRLPRGRCY